MGITDQLKIIRLVRWIQKHKPSLAEELERAAMHCSFKLICKQEDITPPKITDSVPDAAAYILGELEKRE